MTVRMPQAGSGSTRQSIDPYAALRSSPPAATAVGADTADTAVHVAPSGGFRVVLDEAVLPDHESRLDARRAQRAARQQRRHIAMACAVLVAVCLAITILIVGMARNRTPGAQVVMPAVALAIPARTDSLPASPAHQPNTFRGATAPEGGHP
jgi:hypothetical protein